MEIKINVPQNWSGITLREYLQFQNDVKVYGDEDSGYMACILHHFCKVPSDLISKLPTDIYFNIKTDLIEFIGKTDLPLQRIIKIGDVEYGFEPNLSKIAYGAYLDIVKHDTFQIDDNWGKVMSILYRPITKRVGDLYEIEKYNGNIDGDKFLSLGMDIHFGALFFFVHLLEELPSFILKSLKDTPGIPPNIKSTLEKSGEAIAQLYS